MKEDLVKKIFNLYGEKFPQQIIKGYVLVFNKDKVIVRIKNNNVYKQVSCFNINIKRSGIDAVVFFDVDTTQYYAWTTDNRAPIDTKLIYRHSNILLSNPVQLAIAYVFATTVYYNFLDKLWYDTPQPLEIQRVYDYFTAVLPTQFNNRKVYGGTANGGFLLIEHDINEHYDISLPYHKPTLEVFRAENFPHDQSLINGNGGAMDNRTVTASDNMGFYNAFYNYNNTLVKRIGGWRHYKFLDAIYPHNALQYKETVFLDHVYQSSITGQAMTQVITNELTSYELLPSFTDDFYIAIWDYGVNGKPTTDYYGTYIDGYPPIQSRFDPHTWHKITISLKAYNLGLGGLENEKPVLLNYPTYFPDLLANLNINNFGKDKFLITLKSELLSKNSLLQPGDSVLEYTRSVDLDMSLNARYYGLNDSTAPLNRLYYQYPHGINTYLVVEWNSVLNEYEITGKEVKTYPQAIANNGTLLINSVDPLVTPLSINTKSLWNYPFICNYIGQKGIGFHRFNSHTRDLLSPQHLDEPSIDLGLQTLKSPTNIIPGGYLSPINRYQYHGGFPVLSEVYSPNNICWGLAEYDGFFNDLLTNNNPSNSLNFIGHPNFISSQGIQVLIPQFASYWETILQAQSDLGIDNALDDAIAQLDTWIQHSYSLQIDNKIDIIYFDVNNYDFSTIDSRWENPVITTLILQSKTYSLRPCHYDLISPVPNSTFRILLLFPYVVQ